MIVLVLMLFASSMLAVVLLVLLNSPGTPQPFLDGQGRKLGNSISEKVFVELGGVRFGLFLKGKDRSRPVLLYLHGGMPDYFLTQKHPTRLEDVFTVAWWDQRGAGLSYVPGGGRAHATVDDLVEDARRVTDYLRKRFGQDRIYLMGHSGGTYLGIRLIERYPDRYRAYIGVAQISNQKLSEKMAYDFLLARYQETGQAQGIVQRLIDHPVSLDRPLPPEYLRIRDQAMHGLGVGTMRTMRSVVTGLFLPSLFFREYTLPEKINLWRGKASTGVSALWDEMLAHDLLRESTSFEVPVYFFHGVHDRTCSYALARRYFERIEAPDKAFYSFDSSAHSPIFEEPDACVRILQERILAR